MPEAEPLSPRKTAVVLLIVGGCFAILWPRLLQPALLGKPHHDPLAPNNADRAQGCCDVIFEKDVNAIKIMIELCGNILERKSGPLDPRTASAFAAGKLSPDIIRTCRLEVNSTCGVDISTFLQHNIKLGKTYKQILEEVRSYNSSACLKMHYGLPTWALGSGHTVLAGPLQEIDSVKQERPPHTRGPAPHPAMLERGRAIPPTERPRPAPRTPDVVRRAEGRVRSPLSVYYQETEPPPVPGVRPPLGGAGGMQPPPKSSVGFVMPIYTLCIVVFFVYTLCKILFKRTDSSGGNYEDLTPDPMFRSRVFDDRRSSRSSPESKLVVSAISGLVAEVQQQMETNYAQSRKANGAQVTQPENNVPYTNGTLHKARDSSPVKIIAKEFNEFPIMSENINPKDFYNSMEKAVEIPEVKDHILELQENLLKQNNYTNEYEENTPELKQIYPEYKDKAPEIEVVPEHVETYAEMVEKKQSTPELLADAAKDDDLDNQTVDGKEEREEDIHEALSEEEIEYEAEDDEGDPPLVRQLRASVENDTATVKVIGMETTAHCEDGEAWGDRPISPPAAPRPAPSPPVRPHEASEVSSIFLSGDIPQQSRLLVADSHTDARPSGKDSPVILSGKMTLSLINDDAKSTPERDLESPVTQDDDDFTTASAYTQPKLNSQQQEAEQSEEEIEEEVEEIEEEVEVEEDVEVEEIDVELEEGDVELEGVDAESKEADVELEGVDAVLEEADVELEGVDEVLEEADVELKGVDAELEEADVEVEEVDTELEEEDVEIQQVDAKLNAVDVDEEEVDAEVGEVKATEVEEKQVLPATSVDNL